MSIHVLSVDVINQIAAGEVIERPAHLIKELIENSIDAGSTEIIVETQSGAKSVRISDNGEGILSKDLILSLQRHTTSKITASDDLWSLNTFGFRGEALASIAAVSKLNLTSVHKNEKKPSQVSVNFGKISALTEASRTQGTEVKIENLFENLPARLKFLKSETSESQQIKQIVKAMALSHPQVEFKLIQDGNLQLYFQVKKTFLERAQEVLEKNLYPANLKKGSFTVEIAFSSPHEVAKTSKQIWIFVQNRYVLDKALQAAVMDAYRSLLMHGEYPLVVLNLKCDPSEIDVNIHPAKSQIKFQDASGAFRCVHAALRDALEKAPWINRGTESVLNFGTKSLTDTIPSYQVIQPTALSFHDQTFNMTQFKQKNFVSPLEGNVSLADSENRFSTVENNLGNNFEKNFWASMQILGQANLTYIICQKNDRLIYVDQHAAHERVVFESLMAAWKNKKFEMQQYLFPFVIDLNEEKVEALLLQQQQIASLGIHIERLGPLSLGITSAPSIIKDEALPQLFERMAGDLIDNGESYAIEKKVGDLFASMACHSVVRAGQSLSHSQMQELLNSMDQYALSSFCPHGRPVSVETTFVELEKLFGRIN